jgi:hypothetical protein
MKSRSTQTRIYMRDNAGLQMQNLAGMTQFELLTRQSVLRSVKSMALVMVILLASFGNVSGQSPYTSIASGNWNSDATWSGTGIPVAGDIVNISGGVTVTVTANAACASITFVAGTVSNTLSINSAITLAVSGNITIPRGSSPSINTLAVGAGILTVGGNLAFTDGGVSNRHQMTISTGTATITGSVTQVGSSGSATISFTGAGLLRLGGAFLTSATGNLTQGTGTVEYFSAAPQTAGDFDYNNLILSGSGAKTLPATITVGGALTLSGAATATTAAALAIGGNLTVGSGTAFATGATNTWTLSVTGTTSVSGTLTLANTGAKTFTGNVTINSGGVWNETGAAAVNFAGNLQNDGTTFTASTGTHTFSGAAKTISGTSEISIPTVTFTGNTTNSGTLTVATLLTVTGASVSLTNNGIIAATSALSGTGGVTQGTTGILNIGAASAIATLNAVAVGNTVNYTGAAQTVKPIVYHNLALSGSGVKTLTGVSTVNGNLTLAGSATATPATLLTVTGTTSLAGTSILTLGAADILSNAGAITLDGGTFRTGAATGNSEAVGTLNLSANSTIALGTGTHSLNFAASNAVTWTGATLSITGWTGTAGLTGTAGKIFFGSAAGTLSASQLAKISFTGYAGSSAILLSTGELVPANAPNLAITGITAHGTSCVGIAATPILYTITNSGGTASGVTVTSNDAQFVVSGAPTTISGSGGTATYSVTFTPTSAGAKTATITVASTTTGSNSPTSSLTGTGTALPIAGLTSSDPDNSICAGDAVTFTATGGATYEFFVGATSQGAASATATFTTSSLTNGQIVTVKVTNAGSCSATSTGITTTVNAVPIAPIITGTPTVTVGSTTMLGSPTNGGVWTSGTPAVATVNPATGEVTGVTPGTSLIRYTVTNGSGCSNFGTLLVTVSAVTGIEDILAGDDISLKNHPNPFVVNTTISYYLPSEGRVKLIIRNLAGKIVKTVLNETEAGGVYSVSVEFGDLKSGIYIATLSLNTNGKELTKSIRLVRGK